MSARARHLSVVLAVLLAIAMPLAVAAATTPSTSGYRVKSGDTITSIAVQLRLPGGWEQLYSANRDRIGPDPNKLVVGTDLAVPQGVAVPAGQGYVVQSGDTLDSIAAKMHVAGGGAALFAANRNAIGSDPNRLEVGQTLLPPGAAVPPAAAKAKAAAPTVSAPSQSALNRPAAPAPVAQAQGGVPATSDSGGSPVLWAALAALVVVMLAVLLLVGLPRWRRSRADAEVWVGGEYSREHQPEPEAKSVLPKPALPKLPRTKAAPAEGSVVSAFRPGSVDRSSRPDAQPTCSYEPTPTPTPAPLPVPDEGVRILAPDAVPSRPEQREHPIERQPLERRPVERRAVERQPARREPARVREPVPRRDQFQRDQLQRDQFQRDQFQPDLADELFGEVRLVDPSTPLTKDRH